MARNTRAKKQAEAPKVDIGAEIFPSLEELKTAADLLCICVRMATVEQLLREG